MNSRWRFLTTYTREQKHRLPNTCSIQYNTEIDMSRKKSYHSLNIHFSY